MQFTSPQAVAHDAGNGTGVYHAYRGKGATKLPTYSPGTGEKRYKEAEAAFRKENPLPTKKYEWPADAPKRGDAPEPKSNRQRFGKGY